MVRSKNIDIWSPNKQCLEISFSSDEELVNNGFNNLPSLRQIKNTMDTSINSIENDIDDGFAAIDADIKKITFSTMELSHMNNQTLKEVILFCISQDIFKSHKLFLYQFFKTF